jgi:hypothetical protein
MDASRHWARQAEADSWATPTATGMVPEDAPVHVRASLLDPAMMGPPIVWLASSDAEDVHDERIVVSPLRRFAGQGDETGT